MTENTNEPSKKAETGEETPKEEKKQPLDYILQRKSEQADKYKTEAEEYRQKYEELQKKIDGNNEVKGKETNNTNYTSKDEFENFQRDLRIDNFVEKNPEFAEFAETVKDFAKRPEGKNLQTKAMFHMVAGEKLLEIGAKKAQESISNVPNSFSPTGKTEKVDFKNMDDKDFDSLVSKVRSSQ